LKFKLSIPDTIKTEVKKIVKEFNEKEIRDPRVYYTTRFRKNYLYLDRKEYNTDSHVCRLTYLGKIDNWDFAIYKYSREAYDSDEIFFPGYEFVDGTIVGAMKAGFEAYPV